MHLLDTLAWEYSSSQHAQGFLNLSKLIYNTIVFPDDNKSLASGGRVEYINLQCDESFAKLHNELDTVFQ